MLQLSSIAATLTVSPKDVQDEKKEGMPHHLASQDQTQSPSNSQGNG